MKIEFNLTKASAILYLQELNAMIDTGYIGTDGELILERMRREIVAASDREDEQECFNAIEDGEYDRPQESPYFNQRGKMEVF
jgi:hypothetical protein